VASSGLRAEPEAAGCGPLRIRPRARPSPTGRQAHAEPKPPAKGHSASAMAPAAPKADHPTPTDLRAEIQSTLNSGPRSPTAATTTPRNRLSPADAQPRRPAQRRQNRPPRPRPHAPPAGQALTSKPPPFDEALQGLPRSTPAPPTPGRSWVARSVGSGPRRTSRITRFYRRDRIRRSNSPARASSTTNSSPTPAQFEIARPVFQAGNFAEATKFFTRLRLRSTSPRPTAPAPTSVRLRPTSGRQDHCGRHHAPRLPRATARR